jgi:hypothetical protein
MEWDVRASTHPQTQQIVKKDPKEMNRVSVTRAGKKRLDEKGGKKTNIFIFLSYTVPKFVKKETLI